MCSKEFWKYFFVAVGTISSVVTLISFVFQLQQPGWLVIILYILGVVVLSAGFAVWQTWRKKSLKINISNTLTVRVSEGDLFDYAKDENYILIPVNEFFDTIVDNKIIHEGTIHGQFIKKYYSECHEILDKEIKDFMDKYGIEGIKVERPECADYSVKYPLGTSVIIDKDNTHFVLMALTHFDKDNLASVELSELGRSISQMTKFLAGIVGDKTVYMPLMGMGMSRLNQTAQFILKYTIDTIFGIKGLAIPGEINIVIYPPVAKTVNLNEIKY